MSGAPAALRVGLIGAGDISRHHLLAWRQQSDVEVMAVCDLDAARARSRAEEFGIPAVYTDAPAMFTGERLQAVDIATWRATHGPLVRMAAAHGVHVLCQKPLAPTLAESEALVREVAGRVRLMVHENRRWAPHFRTLHEWIAAGKVGTIRQCVMTMHRSGFLPGADGKRPAVVRAPYMGTEERLMIAEVLIHQLDVLRFLLGPLKVVAARTLHTEPDMPGETLATLMLETATGAPVVLAGSFVAPGFGAAVADRLELIGSKASVLMDDQALELRGTETVRTAMDFKAAYQACFDRAIAHFTDCLRTGAPFETAPEDNLETLRLVEDAYRLANQQ